MSLEFFIKKIVFSVILLSYMTLSFLGLVHISDMNHMNMPVNNCPFTSTEYSLCTLNFLDHIKQWIKLSSGYILLQNLFISLGLCFLGYKFIFNFYFSDRLILYLKRQKYKYISYLYQNLFSSGILNSKVF